MGFNKCIICGKSNKDLGDGNQLTIEHIIHKALGNNSLKCSFLCKSCNSKLGEMIDSVFIDSFDMQLIRNQLGIRGRNGIPNPFKKGLECNGHEVYVNEKMQVRIVPLVEVKGNHIHIHAGNKDDAKIITKKTLSRKWFLFVKP